MRVLTIDTATTASCVGLVVDGEVRAEETVRLPNAAQHALGAVDRALRAAGLTAAEVDRIAVGCGPGSFTGLRIGLATARGLAAPSGAELAGIATTSALRAAAGDDAFAVLDARRGEVFAEGPGLALTACTPHALSALAPAGALLVGDGAVAHRQLLAGFAIPADDSALHLPSALAIAEHAEPTAVAPLYVRAPDAEPSA